MCIRDSSNPSKKSKINSGALISALRLPNMRWKPCDKGGDHPAVEQAIVIGIPSDEWGEQVHAEVILKEGQEASPAEIISNTKEYIANYKCPRSISFRTDPFPLSGAGKILKRDIRAPYWKGKGRQIN